MEDLAEAKEDALLNADMTDILTVEMVENLLAAQNFSMPAGYVTEEGIEYLVRVGEKVDDVESLQNMVLIDMEMDGVDTIHLSDVADVFMTDNSDEVYASINGQAGVMLTLQKQTGYSTGDVSDRINKRIAELQEEDPDLLLLPLMDQGIYIDLVTDSVFNNMISGAFLAILILLVFLKSLRPTLVIACSIPISVVAAVVCMYFSGVTLNIISLSGLALGIGMLVDNSIVVIENIYRLRNEGLSASEAVKEGSGGGHCGFHADHCLRIPAYRIYRGNYQAALCGYGPYHCLLPGCQPGGCADTGAGYGSRAFEKRQGKEAFQAL